MHDLQQDMSVHAWNSPLGISGGVMSLLCVEACAPPVG